MSNPHKTSILILGAGELGTAIIQGLTQHSAYNSEKTPISLLQRESTLNSISPEKVNQRESLINLSINLVKGDTDNDSLEFLTQTFSNYNIIIHATGFTSPPGTMTKITQAVLNSKNVQLYIPWQHGVNYDIIGNDGGYGIFKEQIHVRKLLRSQSQTKWSIISCGIFMSLLFENYWGVVNKSSSETTIKITALNSWEDIITTTTANDIGKCTAEIIFNEFLRGSQENKNSFKSGPIFIAGDTLTYDEFADTVGKITKKQIIREVWTLKYLKEEYLKDPENKLKQYRVVFAEGKGLSWDKNQTWNHENDMKMETVEEWMKENFI